MPPSDTTASAAPTAPAAPVTTPPAPATKPEDTIKKAMSYAEDLINYYMTFAGKDGYNPFVYVHSTITPLVDILNDIKVNPTAKLDAATRILSLTKDETNAKVKVVATPTPKAGTRMPVTSIQQTMVRS